jgi:hypothetical protein
MGGAESSEKQKNSSLFIVKYFNRNIIKYYYYMLSLSIKCTRHYHYKRRVRDLEHRSLFLFEWLDVISLEKLPLPL